MKFLVKNKTPSLPLIPYLAKRGQLLLPNGLLPVLVKTPKEILMVKKAFVQKRLIGVIQPKKEMENKKLLYQTGCVGRITTFSENKDGSLYIVIKGVHRFVAKSIVSGLLQVDYAPYRYKKSDLDGSKTKERGYLMTLLKNYFKDVNIDVKGSDFVKSSDESLTTSLGMICPFKAHEKQAILESNSIKERMQMIIAFIEMKSMGCVAMH